MGKYLRKSKADGDVVALDAPQSSFGVRTRAKTRALRKLQQSSVCGSGGGGGGSYLQLRSRKLEKPPLQTKRERRSLQSPNCKIRASARLAVYVKLDEGNERKWSGDGVERIGSGDGEGNVEAFVGDNSSNFAANERSTRESTPCSLIRDIDTVGTPGSNTSASSPAEISKRNQNSPKKLMPDAKEVEEFFAGAEQQQHRHFTDKYNFDPVKDKPLPGRYDWVKPDDDSKL